MSHAARKNAAGIAHEYFENLEAWASRRAESQADDLTRDRYGFTWTDRCQGLQPTAVFVTDRKAREEIFDGEKPRAPEIRSAARTDALEVLQGHLEDVGAAHARVDALLHDNGAPFFNLYLPDARWQREGIVEAGTVGIVGCAGVPRHEFLQERRRDW